MWIVIWQLPLSKIDNALKYKIIRQKAFERLVDCPLVKYIHNTYTVPVSSISALRFARPSGDLTFQVPHYSLLMECCRRLLT